MAYPRPIEEIEAELLSINAELTGHQARKAYDGGGYQPSTKAAAILRYSGGSQDDGPVSFLGTLADARRGDYEASQALKAILGTSTATGL